MHRRRFRRPLGKVYTVNNHHFALIEELNRLFPDREPVIDFSKIKPGTESIESLTHRLYRVFSVDHDERVFMLFCQFNSERILDLINFTLDDNGWPLNCDEILAEMYAELYRSHRRIVRFPGRVHDHPLFPDGVLEPKSIYDLLETATEILVEDQVEQLRSLAIPLPGMPSPIIVPPPKLFKGAINQLEVRSYFLPKKELQKWVVHALLSLENFERRALYLREQRGLSIDQISLRMEVSSLEIARLLKDAQLNLKGHIDFLIERFSAAQGELEEYRPDGPEGEKDG